MIKRTVIVSLVLLTVAFCAFWWYSAHGMYEPRYLACGNAPALGPGWESHVDINDDWELTFYGKRGRFQIHLCSQFGERDNFTDMIVETRSRQAKFQNSTSTIFSRRHYQISAPFWLLVISPAIYPVVAFIRGPLRRRARRKRNQCVHCGYDLTGNVSGVCPECGKES